MPFQNMPEKCSDFLTRDIEDFADFLHKDSGKLI
jgi:hypothetical protein